MSALLMLLPYLLSGVAAAPRHRGPCRLARAFAQYVALGHITSQAQLLLELK
jgi:hypothetical protein